MTVGRYAVVPTHSRPVELAACLAALAGQVDTVVVVDNASTPPVSVRKLVSGGPRTTVVVLRDEEQPPNLSRLWNAGLDQVEKLATAAGQQLWDVAVLNDDATVSAGWFDAVSTAMRDRDAVAGCSTGRPGRILVHGPNASLGVSTRLTGWAFLLRGESRLRADERFRWWCGDDDLSHRARIGGGLVHVPGFPVPNTRANSTTNGVLADQAALDMQTFVDVWGRRPW